MSRLLLIEHDQTTRGILTDVLRTEGYKLTAIPGISDAIEQVICGDYTLVIADISADYDAGIELVLAVKAEKSSVAIILITDAKQNVDSVGEGDIFAHVAKPLKMDELLALVQRALDFNQQAVDDMQSVLARNDYRFSVAVRTIVLSPQFQRIRGRDILAVTEETD